MTKKTYWMTNGYGSKALIEGADERDRWKPLGWSVVDGEPAAGMVWMRHEVHGGRAEFPIEVASLWQQKGWQPSDPPPPADPFNAANPADVATPVPATPSAAALPTAPAPAGKPTTSMKETQADG
ncbi:hypothetical protein OOK41_09030 [Micromonospora sp. NBC_01655]|uniref:hypothetical protein n=1 Tax=Micromonospora sp. NBC_01655 TaxID=2975983 RepID=UPI00224D76D1|nr:hypothetical protein [Micromonospora sp. NBC_01655]MCX4470448.1 hypothetical protein [Micromonospora sp. NBC_01655]